jgi:hypothetical protein
MGFNNFVFSTYSAKMPPGEAFYLSNHKKLNLEGSAAFC